MKKYIMILFFFIIPCTPIKANIGEKLLPYAECSLICLSDFLIYGLCGAKIIESIQARDAKVLIDVKTLMGAVWVSLRFYFLLHDDADKRRGTLNVAIDLLKLTSKH